jgi:capsid protein
MYKECATDSSPEQRLQESLDAFWDRFVDPEEALYDADGTFWNPLSGDALPYGTPGIFFYNEGRLREIRTQCRALALNNEFAINGQENRISYIVGAGYSYRAAAKDASPQSAHWAAQVQAVLDEFIHVNKWQQRQQEIVRRKDRDGECFLRFFDAADGSMRVRFIEPEQVFTPPEQSGDPAASMGVLTDADDVETVRGYFVDGRLVPAADIQHRKANVDANVKRGLSLFYPVRKNLRRAEKLLRNMSVVAEIQSAIAIIRKHSAGTRTTIQQFAQGEADASVSNACTGQTSYFRRYGPGTILDALAGTDYEFPAAGIDAGRYVIVLQAELRAIAARLVMPEFMLTSDASNANYASTMVAEGPAVRMFQRLQYDMLADDLEVMWRVVRGAAGAGHVAPEALEAVDIRGTPPSLAVRDALQDAQADRILVASGAMSLHTMALRHGLDPEAEQRLIAQQRATAPAKVAQNAS